MYIPCWFMGPECYNVTVWVITPKCYNSTPEVLYPMQLCHSMLPRIDRLQKFKIKVPYNCRSNLSNSEKKVAMDSKLLELLYRDIYMKIRLICLITKF